jgi:hypothetical protein
MEDHVIKRLSEQLADPSVCANSAGDTVAAAKKKALDKIAARKEARSGGDGTVNAVAGSWPEPTPLSLSFRWVH